MKATQLRNDFHTLIDRFSDVKVLEQLYEVISDFHEARQADSEILDELTKDQDSRLKASIEQAQTGRTPSHYEVKGKVRDWLTK